MARSIRARPVRTRPSPSWPWPPAPLTTWWTSIAGALSRALSRIDRMPRGQDPLRAAPAVRVPGILLALLEPGTFIGQGDDNAHARSEIDGAGLARPSHGASRVCPD